MSAHTFQPEGVSEGWTASQLVSNLRKRGRRMTVFTAAIPRLTRRYGVVGINCATNADVPYLPIMNYLEYSVRSLAATMRIRRRFAVVHHVSPIVLRMPSFFGILGRPFIWGPVGGSIPYPPGFEGYGRPNNAVNALRRLDRPRFYLDPTMQLTMRTADRIVVTASMAAEVIPNSHRDKVIVIPEGIPESLVLPVAPEEEPYIFSSGRLIEYKAMDILIKAFAQLRSTGVKLVITGEGPKKPELLALIDKLRLGDMVRLCGRVQREENHRLMSRSLFCVFPALREAFGHVNLEAMAAWKPVVVTDWGGPRDLIDHGVTGLKVLGRNSEEHIQLMANAMDQLMGDAELRRRMGLAAAQRAAGEYTWPVLAARYDAIYRELE